MGLQLQVKTFVPVAASTTALGAAQTVSGAANFTLTSAATNGTYANAILLQKCHLHLVVIYLV